MTALARTLGLRDLTLLIVGTVIGSGIFIVPGAVLRQVDGLVVPAMLVWLAGGILSLLGIRPARTAFPGIPLLRSCSSPRRPRSS